LINLTVNALKYSPKGGRVRVWARRDQDPAVIRMGVTDEGPGIAPEDQTTLFERFRQVQSDGGTTRQGFGLGLSIARELVLLNLGKIGVESQLSQGSTFWFTLPTASPEAVARQLMTAINPADVLGLTDRIESARQEANRNRPSSPLPWLHFQILHMWRHDESVEPFVAQVIEAAGCPAGGTAARDDDGRNIHRF
jgi:hypothetical protein